MSQDRQQGANGSPAAAATSAAAMEVLERVHRSGALEALPAVARLVENGDLERLVALARVVSAAEDSVTDDMISRLAATAGGGMDLLDQVNRSGIDQALPVLSRLVASGDLDRVGELPRLLAAAQDSVTDDMVSRVAETAGRGMDLVDRVTRAGVEDALPAVADLIHSGDFERVARLARLVAAAEDSVTDDMVVRLAAMGGAGLDMLDQASRAGLMQALPAVTELIESGDLDRVVKLARLVSAAEDSVTDDMIARFAHMGGTGMDLLDQVSRSDIGQALPGISRMVANGDLDRLVDIVRLYSAAEDALTDEMIGRLVDVMGEGISVVDTLNRSGVRKLVCMLQQFEERGAWDKLADVMPRLLDQVDMLSEVVSCFESASRQVREHPGSGGIGGLGSLMGALLKKENQQFLQFVLALGGQMQQRCISRGADQEH